KHHRNRPPDRRAPLTVALDDPRQAEFRRQRLVGDRRERGPQQFTLLGEAGDAPANIRMRLEIGGDFRLPLRLKHAVHIGMKIVLGDGAMAHFALRNATTLPDRSFAAPSISCCSLSRARESRDITVPMGISSTLAASA